MMIKRFFHFLMGKKTAADVGSKVPSNFKFGVIVAIALFWADLLRVLLSEGIFYLFETRAPILTNFLIAVVATIVGILALEFFTRIRHWLEEIVVKDED